MATYDEEIEALCAPGHGRMRLDGVRTLDDIGASHAARIVGTVLAGLHNRRGYRRTWDSIDHDDRRELVAALLDRVEAVL